jgi:hypothetical protein
LGFTSVEWRKEELDFSIDWSEYTTGYTTIAEYPSIRVHSQFLSNKGTASRIARPGAKESQTEPTHVSGERNRLDGVVLAEAFRQLGTVLVAVNDRDSCFPNADCKRIDECI